MEPLSEAEKSAISNVLIHSIPEDLVARAIAAGVGHPFLYGLLKAFGPLAAAIVKDLVDSVASRTATPPAV